MNQKRPEKIVRGLGIEENEFRAHIRSKGRIVIPKEVRDTLSIKEGSLLRCKIRKVVHTVGENSGKGRNEMRHRFAGRPKKHGVSLEEKETTGRLDDLLLDAVDKTMKQVFKEVGAEAIYNYLENVCHLRREEIAKKPEVFSAGLERLLGSGASLIESLILKDLYRKLGLEIEEKKGYEFLDWIKELVEKILVVKA